MNKEEDYISRIQSKNWKERQECYVELGTEFESGKYLNLVIMLQNENNIPALESGIDAILKCSIIPEINSIKKIFNHIGNNKTSIKTRIYKLIHFCNINDDLFDCLCELLNNKSPKVVSNTVSVLSEIDTRNVQVLKSLNLIFNHPDKNVRIEGVKLAVELYKKIGNEIKRYLDIKPIQMKELEEEFSKYGIHEEKLISVQEIPFDKINDPKWNIRLEGLKVLKDAVSTNADVPNLSNILGNKINDPNNQVLFMVLDILNITKNKTSKIINGLIERLKDKKVNITDKIKDTLVNLELDTISTVHFSSKSPELKSNLIDVCLRSSIKDPVVIKCIGNCTEDSNGQVRNKAVEALCKLEFNIDILPSSVQKKINSKKNEEAKNMKNVINEENKIVINEENNNNEDKSINTEKIEIKKPDEKKIEKTFERSFSFVKENNSFSKNILESFIYKYPFLKDQSWTVRRDGILSHKKYLILENITDFCTFLLSSKDPNFIVNNALIDILIERKNELADVEELIVLFIIDKITEIKLKTKLLELANCITPEYTVKILVEEACKIKRGKKFIEIIKLLKDINNKEKEIESIFKISFTGIQENKCVEELKKMYFSVSEESIKEIKVENEVKQVIPEIKSEKIVVDIKEKVLFLMKEGDINEVVDLLDKIDKISISEKIIEYYITKDVQSTLFNTLLIYFITNKYILTEKECICLVTHFISKNMIEEMSMVDRVYPVTKLFFVLQNINTDESVEYILKLIEKYKMFSGDKKKLVKNIKKNDLKKVMRESVDFLSFIDEIDDSEKNNGTCQAEDTEKVICKNEKLEKNNLSFKVKDKKNVLYEDQLDNPVNIPRDIKEKFSSPILKNVVSQNFSSTTQKIVISQNSSSTIQKIVIPQNSSSTTQKTILFQCSNSTTQKKEALKNSKPENFAFTQEKSNHCIPKKVSSPITEKFTCNSSEKLIAPSVYESSFNVDIEASLDCLNISGNRLTPNLKKFRKEFNSPMKNINNLEDILDNIIDSDQEKSEEAFKKLLEIIRTNINTVLFSANSIISSISIQLLDVIHRPLYAKLILNVLLKLSQSKIFCEQIRKETLESVNLDLITILKGTDQILSDIVSDILTNICLNSKMSIILEVYFNLLSEIRENDIPLKLLWRHSKSLEMKNKEEIQKCLSVIENFYKKSVYSELLENTTTFKISILHIREIWVYFQEGIKKFNIGRYVRRIIEKIQDDKEININVLRK